MKRFGAFLVATTLGGLFVVLPVILVLVLLSKAVMTVHGVAEAIMAKMAGQKSEAAEFPIIFSVLIVLAISFAIGLATLSQHGRKMGRWLEGTLFLRLPGYAALRAIIGGLGNASHERKVKPGLLTMEHEAQCFVLIIEDHGPDRFTIYIPGSPNPASGSVQIVLKERVRVLNVGMTDIAGVLHQWGIGSGDVIAKHRAATSNDSTLRQ